MPGYQGPDTHAIKQFFRYTFRDGNILPKLDCLDTFPLCKAVAALITIRCPVALKAFHPFFHRAQPLDYPTQMDEFRTIDL